jgi:hypothetical protein
MSVFVVRAFVRLRRSLAGHADLSRRLDELQKKYDAKFKVVFDAIRELMTPPKKGRRSIGFRVEEAGPRYGAPRGRRTKGARRLAKWQQR